MQRLKINNKILAVSRKKVLKGKVDRNSSTAYYKVDGISGATITSKGLEKFLLDDLKKYDPFFQKIRLGKG